MSELVSIQKAAMRCRDLIGTKDVNDWTSGFLSNVCDKVSLGLSLSEKQEAKLLEIYAKHFANAPDVAYTKDVPVADASVGIDDLDRLFDSIKDEDEIILHSDKYDRS